MSQQGPILIVSRGGRPSFASALDETKLFPVVDTDWADAARAVEQLRPGAVLASTFGADKLGLEALAKQTATREPYLPLIVVDPETDLPDGAIPFAYSDDSSGTPAGAHQRSAAGALAARDRDAPAGPAAARGDL